MTWTFYNAQGQEKRNAPKGDKGDPAFPPTANLNFGGFKATVLGYPTLYDDAATKEYVDDNALEQIVGQGIPAKIAWGTDTLSVVGQAVGTLTVNHGLGVVPVFAVCTPFDLTDPTKMLVANWRGASSTQIIFSIKRIGAATTTDLHTFYWAAIGQQP